MIMHILLAYMMNFKRFLAIAFKISASELSPEARHTDSIGVAIPTEEEYLYKPIYTTFMENFRPRSI